MINPQWLELPMSRTNFHGPFEVFQGESILSRVVDSVVISESSLPACRNVEVFIILRASNEDSDQTARMRSLI